MTIVKAPPAQDLFIASAFNPSSLSIYHLGVYLERDSALYTISTVQDEPLFIRFYKNRDGLELSRFLEILWQEDDYLRKRFAKVFFVLDAEKWLPVPAEYVPDGSEAGYLASYYEITEGALSAYQFRKDVVRGTGAAIIYGLERPLYEFLASRLSSALLLHRASRCVQITQNLAEKPISQRPFTGIVFLHLNYFFYVLFQGSRLIFVNGYHAATAEDVLYYIQGLHNLLGIGRGDVGVAVGGYSVLKPYVVTYLYQFFGAGYRDLGKLFPAPSALRETDLGVEDVLPLTGWGIGADTAG